MSKPVPPISKYMTTSPHTIGLAQPLVVASKMMSEHRIRHLPVLEGGKLLGVLTERDIALIETLKDVDPRTVTVEDAMTQNPYTTAPDAPIDRVASEMAEHKYGCAIVMQNDKVVGVFTSVDACAVLAEVFATRLK
jgi:acetoin utilization protein AcuB